MQIGNTYKGQNDMPMITINESAYRHMASVRNGSTMQYTYNHEMWIHSITLDSELLYI